MDSQSNYSDKKSQITVKKLCDEAVLVTENLNAHKLWVYQSWRSLKLDLDKLNLLLRRLTRELTRMRENRTKS